MLPELLFSVSSSMQDISRDDFGLLNGVSCDTTKDHNHHNLHSLPPNNGHQHSHSNAGGQPQQNHLHQLNQPSHNQHQHQFPPSQQPHLSLLLHTSNANGTCAEQQLHHQQQQQQHPLITGTDCTLEPVKLGRTPELQHLQHQQHQHQLHDIAISSTASAATEPVVVAIKLEEPDVIYPWHSTSVADIGSNLLCHSDDPLISGAIDDNQNEFNPIHSVHNHTHPHHHLHHLASAPPSNSVSCSLIKAEEPLGVHAPLLLHHTNHHHQHHHSLADISAASIAEPAAATPPETSVSVSNSITVTAVPSAVVPAPRKKASAPRTRRKGQLKLRFHHQALPQEYLDHYEATQNSQQRRDIARAAASAAAAAADQLLSVAKPPASRPAVSRQQQQPPLAPLPQQQQQQQSPTSVPLVLPTLDNSDDPQHAAARAHDSVRNWLQKISEFQHEAAAAAVIKSEPPETTTTSPSPLPPRKAPASVTAANSGARIVNYSDLPFMGEMTLDNSKPRRGRKPKKADICHLIYKNYGTILPGTPKDLLCRSDQQPLPVAVTDEVAKRLQASMVELNGQPAATVLQAQTTITPGNLTTLLEQRLMSDDLTMADTADEIPAQRSRPHRVDEPLNLCLRDRSAEPFTVLSSDEEEEANGIDNDMLLDPSGGRCNSSTRPPTASDTDSLLAANMRMSLPNFQSALLLEAPSAVTSDTSHSPAATFAPTPSSASSSAAGGGFVYWPQHSTTQQQQQQQPFIHPMALYYQQMVADAAAAGVAPHLSSTAMPLSLHAGEPTAKILIPKNISELLRQHQPKALPAAPSPSASPSIRSTASSNTRTYEPCNTPTATTSPASSSSIHTTPNTTTATGTVTAAAPPAPTPHKRKRSAIFIPPMPSADQSSGTSSGSHHATEVSICKFKFTGGAKPSLQEKKMLSVDAGGNFRYYSGTGDKSMRGYEFFPRESLQQSSAMQAAGGSSAGAFLSTTGERISLDVLPPPSMGLSNEVLQLPLGDLPSPTATAVGHFMQAPVVQQQQQHGGCFVQPPLPGPSGRISPKSAPIARKSRRSLQREKLERTFKEKGFLIQTQQLESAEGATYCKFRQLRKFTRYLFRSWKDYLPAGELQQAAAAAAGERQQSDGDGGVGMDGVMPSEDETTMMGGSEATRMLMSAAAAAAADANSIGMQELMLAEHQGRVMATSGGASAEEH